MKDVIKSGVLSFHLFLIFLFFLINFVVIFIIFTYFLIFDLTVVYIMHVTVRAQLNDHGYSCCNGF